jgi:hypothetical protein
VAGGYLFLAHRGVVRWLALAVVILSPVTVLVIFAMHGLLWVALVAVALIGLAAGAGWRALAPAAGSPGSPTLDAPPPQRAFLIMNPRSGGRQGRQVRAETEG